MPPRRPAPTPKPITNEDLAAQIAGAESRLGKRIDRLEQVVVDSGLNGHTPLLKQFLDTYSSQRNRSESYAVVRADMRRRFRWLVAPKNLLKLLVAAIISGVGWKIASGQIPHF